MFSPFLTRATGGLHAIDRAEVRRALGILVAPDQTFALQGLPSAHWRVCSGADLDAAVEAVYELSDGAGVYWTLNPCRPGLTAMPKTGDVLSRRWFLVDVDRRGAGETNASEPEKLLVTEVAYRVSDYLWELGWPNPVMSDSGNGNHLYYRVDLPNDPLSRSILKAVLAKLKSRFDAPTVEIDGKVIDARRISKLPGTWARKGPHTDDRPHRLARLVFVPDPLEVVSVEHLQAVGTPPPIIVAPAPSPSPHLNGAPFTARASSPHDDLSHYVQSAIDRECARIELTPPGARNDALNVAAHNLGTLAMWPEMILCDARTALVVAALRSGLTDFEARKTIESGWLAGAAKPRPRPVPAIHGPTIATVNGAATVPVKLTIGLDEIVEEDVDWIYENVIAIGFISIFAGQTGQGKSFVVCDLIARLTRGDVFPFSADRRPASRVLMISEDPLEQMLGPRLNSMGAIGKSVRFMTWEAMASYTLHDTDMLDLAYLECDLPILLVIDPPQNFLGRTDEHKNAEVRTVLMRVVAWLQKRLAACILIMHVNKQIGKGLAALDRIMGSVAWATTPRIAMGFTDNPDAPGEHIMAGIKNNLGPKAQAVGYRIERIPANPKRAKIEWSGTLDISADDAMNCVKKKPVGISAVEWITDRFREQPEWESNELRRLAKDAGVSLDAIFKGPEVAALPIIKRPRVDASGNKTWTWRVKPGWPGNLSESSESSESCNVNHSTETTSELSVTENPDPKVQGIRKFKLRKYRQLSETDTPTESSSESSNPVDTQ